MILAESRGDPGRRPRLDRRTGSEDGCRQYSQRMHYTTRPSLRPSKAGDCWWGTGGRGDRLTRGDREERGRLAGAAVRTLSLPDVSQLGVSSRACRSPLACTVSGRAASRRRRGASVVHRPEIFAEPFLPSFGAVEAPHDLFLVPTKAQTRLRIDLTRNRTISYGR